MSLVEVTEGVAKVSKVREQKMIFITGNLQIPAGKYIHVRKFVCEMRYQERSLARSKEAELIIVSSGNYITKEHPPTPSSHTSMQFGPYLCVTE